MTCSALTSTRRYTEYSGEERVPKQQGTTMGSARHMLTFAGAMLMIAATPLTTISWAQTPKQPATSPAKPVESKPVETPPPATVTASIEPRSKRVDPASIKSADDLLAQLETADAGINTLAADVKLLRTFGKLEAGTHERRGNILFITKPHRMFRVDFDTLIVDGVKRAEAQTFIFDGSTLIERNTTQRQQIERHFVNEKGDAQAVDPLAIGEGPFPVPVGQKKDQVLRRFTAELLKPNDGFPTDQFPPALADTFQLRLVPKAGTPEAKDFKEIRVWYLKDTLMPRMARTRQTNDESIELVMINQQENVEIEAQQFNTMLPENWPPAQVTEIRRKSDENTDARRP
jgi:hypothetical protein